MNSIQTTLVIIGYHQTNNIDKLKKVIDKLTIKPDQIIYGADRPTNEELSVIKSTNWDIVIPDVNDAIIVRENNGFFAPYIRNCCYEKAIGDNIISLDGDMIPNGEIVSAYNDVLSNYNIATGKRLEEHWLFQDCRELYGDNPLKNIFKMNQPIKDKHLYFDIFNTLWSCNFGFTKQFYNKIKKLNYQLFKRNEFFNSYFNGSYGGEDTALGAEAFLLNEFVYAIDNKNADATHIAHPRPSNKYSIEVHEKFTRDFLCNLDKLFLNGGFNGCK